MGTERASPAVRFGAKNPTPSAVDGIYALGGLSEAAPSLSFEPEETLREHEDSEHHGGAGLGILWALGLEAAAAAIAYGIWLIWRPW